MDKPITQKLYNTLSLLGRHWHDNLDKIIEWKQGQPLCKSSADFSMTKITVHLSICDPTIIMFFVIISHHPCESCTKWNKALSICDPTIIMFLVIISQHPCKHCTKWNKALSIYDPTIIMFLVIISQHPCEHCTKWSKAFKASIILTQSMQ